MKNDDTMQKKTYRLDPIAPPKLTDDAKARYDTAKDEDIDYSDIPDMGEVDWRQSAAAQKKSPEISGLARVVVFCPE